MTYSDPWEAVHTGKVSGYAPMGTTRTPRGDTFTPTKKKKVPTPEPIKEEERAWWEPASWEETWLGRLLGYGTEPQIARYQGATVSPYSYDVLERAGLPTAPTPPDLRAYQEAEALWAQAGGMPTTPTGTPTGVEDWLGFEVPLTEAEKADIELGTRKQEFYEWLQKEELRLEEESKLIDEEQRKLDEAYRQWAMTIDEREMALKEQKATTPEPMSEYQREALERERQEVERAYQLKQEELEQRRREAEEQQKLQQQRFEWEQAQALAQAQEQERRYIAQLAAQPLSWLEYAAYTQQPPKVQPWMLPLMSQQYPELQAGGAIPGWTPESMTEMPSLINPSAQLWARMGPAPQQQYMGYEQARTGATPEDVQWWIQQSAPPSGMYGGLRYAR